MQHITIDARMIKASGIGVYLQNIIPFLLNEFNVTLIGNFQEEQQFDWFNKVTLISSDESIYSLREQWMLLNKVPVSDLLWSPHYNIPLLPVKAKKRVVTIHDVFHLAFKQTLSLPQKVYANVFLKAATKISDKVITVSEFSKTEIIKYTKVAPSKVKVVLNGVDLIHYKKLNKLQSKDLLQHYLPQLPDNYILFVGNVKPHKNLKTLLQAFSFLKEEIKINLNLVIVGKKDGFITGDSSLIQTIEQDPHLKEHVYFTGYVEDEHLPLIYNTASLFVFPSLYEGFGLPPLEAMACGCPVIASDIPSIKEICGEAAAYFSPLDALNLKNQMKEMLLKKENSTKFEALGLKQANQYNWQAAAKQHIQIFEQLIKS